MSNFLKQLFSKTKDDKEFTDNDKPSTSWLGRLQQGLSRSTDVISTGITDIFNKKKLDSQTLEELESLLIRADLGIEMASRIVQAVSKDRYDREINPEEIKSVIASEIEKILVPVAVPFQFGEQKPFVVLVVGVNGAGKTTTIGKLSAIASAEGNRVVLAACDTFRAAAINQLRIWADRSGAEIISREPGADSAGLAYDALARAKQIEADILFIDTAGRLQNKIDLMAELEKIIRVLRKIDHTAPHAVLLVLDATTGQNAILQAEAFTKVAAVTGLIMTKLDGTARGGILVSLADKLGIPVHAIGVGENTEDLQPFQAATFAKAIVGLREDV